MSIAQWDSNLSERASQTAQKITEGLFGNSEQTGKVAPWIREIIASEFSDLTFLQEVCEAAKEARRLEREYDEAMLESHGSGIIFQAMWAAVDAAQLKLNNLLDHEIDAEGQE